MNLPNSSPGGDIPDLELTGCACHESAAAVEKGDAENGQVAAYLKGVRSLSASSVPQL